jgi:hypothetical protein
LKQLLNLEIFESCINQMRDTNKRMYRYWSKNKVKRWSYLSQIIDEIKLINPDTILELGTNCIALSNFSDSINLKPDRAPINSTGQQYFFNAKKIPWNINKKYDLFIALQVFEHLNPKQSVVFDYVKNTCRKCIISLPYNWNFAQDALHLNINDQIIAEWTNYKKPYKKTVVSDPRNKNIVILCFDFLSS